MTCYVDWYEDNFFYFLHASLFKDKLPVNVPNYCPSRNQKKNAFFKRRIGDNCICRSKRDTRYVYLTRRRNKYEVAARLARI